MKKYIKILAFFLLFGVGMSASFAQMFYIPYYGKNKVMYTKFKWESYSTEHFDIYYYTKDTETLKILANMAESAYLELSEKIRHQLSAPIPLLFFQTITDFEQTNLFPISEGVLGVAEPLLYRVAVHGDMPPDELQNLIEHEITHIFEYDLLWGSPGGAIYSVSRPPGWVFEGFSEYNTDHWSPLDKLAVRDAVLNDRIPEMTESGQIYTQYPMVRSIDYTFGHAIFEFIEHKYGKAGIKNFWQSLKNTPFFGRVNPIRRAFRKDPKEFAHEFKKYLREQNKHFLLRENPEDYSIPIGPEYPMNEFWFAFSMALSPAGEIVAVQTINAKDNDFDIITFSTKDGKKIKNLTSGFTLKYEYIKLETDPSLGANLDWSPDGDKLAFFARSGKKYSLFIIDAMSGKILNEMKIPEDRPLAPRFLKNNKELLYTAFTRGVHDIYKVNLELKTTANLTRDNLFEKAPAVSPDGTKVAYSIRVGSTDKVFISPLDNLQQKTQLTFGEGNTVCPEFSSDGSKVFFSGDHRDSFNIYSLDLETGEQHRYTDVRTGNFFPTPVPEAENTFVFASFNKSSYQIFKSELEPELEKTVTFVDDSPEPEENMFKPILSFEIDKDEIKPYKGLGKLYMVGRPPVDTIFATDGSIYGGSALSFADLFHDHSFTLMAYQYRDFRSYQFSYLNQKNRLQYMASAFKYTLFYYPYYSYFDPTLFQYMGYRDSIATRTISGATLSGYYPFNLYYRLEGYFQYAHYAEDYYDISLYKLYQQSQASSQYFWNGNVASFSLALTGETTRFKSYGPAYGNTFRIGLSQSIPFSDAWIKNTQVNLDYRHYLNIGGDWLLAFRFKGFASRGKNPYISYFGGNNEVRSQYYYSMVGSEGWFANLEFRFPLINIAATLIGTIGPIRGTFFLDMARTKLKGQPATMYVVDFDFYGMPYYRQVEALGSYGFGLEFFIMGLPLHLDFVKQLSWDKFSAPLIMRPGGNG